MLLAVSRVRDRAAVPGEGPQAATRRQPARPPRGGAGPTASSADSDGARLARLAGAPARRELAHVTRHDPHVPAESEPLEAALEGADAVVVAATTRASKACSKCCPTASCWWIPGTSPAPGACSGPCASAQRSNPLEPRAGDRGRQRSARWCAGWWRPPSRCACPISARRQALDARGLRGAHRQPARPSRSAGSPAPAARM